jgi:hypothetical protein
LRHDKEDVFAGFLFEVEIMAAAGHVVVNIDAVVFARSLG